MPEPATAAEATGSTIEEEVQRLKEKSLPELPTETVEIAYRAPDGEIIDPKETVPLERVVDDNINYHASQRRDGREALVSRVPGGSFETTRRTRRSGSRDSRAIRY